MTTKTFPALLAQLYSNINFAVSFSLSCFNHRGCSTSCLKSFIKLDYAVQQCGKLRKHMS